MQLNATAMLDRAATEGDLPTVRKCLQNGANVDAAEPMVREHDCVLDGYPCTLFRSAHSV